MKKLLPLLLTVLFPAAALAALGDPAPQGGPYLQGIWTKGAPVYVSQGAAFMPSSLAYDRTLTKVAVLYHPLSAGSLIPPKLQVYLPPESWACTLGAGYAGAQGGASVGVGCGLNLLDSVRGWASRLLSLSNNDVLNRIGDQIAPGQGPLGLFASRDYVAGQKTPLRWAPRWSFGASFGF